LPGFCQAKTFYGKEVNVLAISRQRKEEMLAQYTEWFNKSQAVILVQYSGVTVKELDAIRAKIRETGGEFHILKNTLAERAFRELGVSVPADLFEQSTAATLAFDDVAATSKALADVTRGIEAIKIKGGFMEQLTLNESQVKALASLPPLPVVRSQLLGVLQAPAGKLVRTLAEPARQVASVLRAYSETPAPAAARPELSIPNLNQFSRKEF
jgi:large subunit ribosomal protein L10